MRIPLERPSGHSLLAQLRSAQGGNGEAQESLLAMLHGPVLDYVKGYTRRMPDDGDMADDVAQETLIRIATYLHSCRAVTDEQVLGWALAIARTRLIDEIRKARRRAERMTLETTTVVHPLAGAPSPAPTILGGLLRKVVRGLPPETRLLLDLRVEQGGTWAEVAEGLRTTAAGAKRRFQRAQARVQRELDGSADRLPAQQREAVHARLRKLK